MAYVLVGIGCSYILMLHAGLRTAVGLSCTICFLASVLRSIPCWFSPTSVAKDHDGFMWFIYVAQFMNAAAAPLTQAAPSLISQIWFPTEQRALATGIARQSNSCGRAVGFFLGPAIVKIASDLPTLLYVEIGTNCFINLTPDPQS